MKKAYWGQYKWIEDDANDKAIGIKIEFEIEIRD